MISPSFWAGKRVLLTGHTGFKGSWCALWLSRLGAEVSGLALPPDTSPALYEGACVGQDICSFIGDIREKDIVDHVVDTVQPQIVLHMAAQPLVRRSVRDPVTTFSTNVMGTVHLLDALCHLSCLEAVLVITTDKVYRNLEQDHVFREDDPLGGHDPYSASKAGAEFVAHAYAQTFLKVPVATARAGNIIGGGDYSEDRLIPDICRAVEQNIHLSLRFPDACRPWLHVLDGLYGYLSYVEALACGHRLPSALNFAPAPEAALMVKDIARLMLDAFGSSLSWVHEQDHLAPEAVTLRLDARLAEQVLGWRPRFGLMETMQWYQRVKNGLSMRDVCLQQIQDYGL